MDETTSNQTKPLTEFSIREKLRQHDAARYFVMEAMTGLLTLIKDTRPDWVLGMTKGDKDAQLPTTGIELKEWNEEWVTNARTIIKELWKSGNLMASDVTAVMETLKKESARKK